MLKIEFYDIRAEQDDKLIYVVICVRYKDKWFFRLLEEGFLYVKNPMNPKQIGRIELSPEEAEFIVFWTKNPAPMLNQLDKLKNYPLYFHFILNPYDKKIEPNVPKKSELIKTFCLLSEKIGKENINVLIFKASNLIFKK